MQSVSCNIESVNTYCIGILNFVSKRSVEYLIMSMRFGAWVKEQLGSQSLRQADIVRENGINSGLLSRVLSGEIDPSGEIIIAIAHTLRMPPEDVFRVAYIPGSMTTCTQRAMELLSCLSDEGIAIVSPILRSLVKDYPAIPDVKEDTHPSP